MPETPHLNPLPLRKGRGGSERTAKAVRTAWFVNRAINVVIVFGVLAVAARLILINQPYVDHWSWRQSDVAAIARNFYEGGFRFAYPQIDWAGDATGYVGTEFPILPFFAAMCYKVAGIHEWIERSQAVIFFAVSLPFFFLLVREVFDNTAAAWATFFFSFAPLNVFTGRSFMPDAPSLSLAIIGLYFFLRWIREHEWAPLLVAAIVISLSILIKATSIIVAVPLLYLAIAGIGDPGRREIKLVTIRDRRSRLQLLLFAALAVLPSVAWYWHAYQIAQRFYPYHLFGAGGIRIENFSWYWAIARETMRSSLTPILAILALVGLFVALRLRRCSTAGRPRSKYSALFHWWLVATVLFVIIAGYGNRHRWYQLPFVPITAALAGAACAFLGSKISSRVVAITLSILVASSFGILSFLCVRPLYESSAAQLRDAGLELDKITAPDALIVAADTGDPTIFYYARRKGWHFLEKDGIYAGNPSDNQEAITNLEELRRRGATHVALTTNTFWWLDYYPEFAQHLNDSAVLIEATPEFKIYKLSPIAR
jgi:4-amino-4-deoxy-L-arabinose transferase-like glycosyltransferase